MGLLLKRGLDVNSRDKLGNTVLHRAVKVFNSETVETLLEKRADVNAQNNMLETPIHVAISAGNTGKNF